MCERQFHMNTPGKWQIVHLYNLKILCASENNDLIIVETVAAENRE